MRYSRQDEFLVSVRQQLKVPAAARGAFKEATTLYKEDERWVEPAARVLSF